MKQVILSIIVILISSISFGQTGETEIKDSLKKRIEFGVMGQWQKGNLEQFSIMPNTNLKLFNSSFRSEVNVTYNYLVLGGFNPVNDFWMNGLFQYKPDNRVFATINAINGFAKSYKIDGSFFNSAGVGVNLIQKTDAKQLQLSITSGYLHFKFADAIAHSTLGFGSMINGLIPLSKYANLKWRLSTYHSSQDHTFWGGGNLLKIDMMLSKHFFVNIMHQLYYHHKEVTNTKKYTSIMQFGIAYKTR